jgi:hypothetical protein
MSERIYRLIVGLAVLGILYLDSRPAMSLLIALLVFEGITNWRIPLLVSRLRGDAARVDRQADAERRSECRFNFESERALRLLFAGVLLTTYIFFNQGLWLFPWFAGFALTVAGLSGICPMLMFIEKLGFKPSGRRPAASAQD